MHKDIAFFATGTCAALLAAAAPAQGADKAPAGPTVTAQRSVFGHMPDGEEVTAVKLTARNGVSAVVLSWGATLQALNAPDRNGKAADITLGCDDLECYLRQPNYWGQTIGRYANRIGNAKFALNGKTYDLTANNGPNSLHGGTVGFDQRVWKVDSIRQGAQASVTLSLVSPDGDQAFPGRLLAKVTYTLDNRGSLVIDFDATTDAPTVVNLTNHALFNLAGEGSSRGLAGQRMTIPASRFLPVDTKLIPTGEFRPVAGTVFDFRKSRDLSNGIRDGRDTQIAIGRGWDHNFVLDKGATAQPGLAARVEDPVSGRVLEVLTTEPGIQFYSGNFIVGSLVGKGSHVYRMGDALALEPQKFPDTPNKPAFGSARLNPGETYHHRMVYRLSATPNTVRK